MISLQEALNRLTSNQVLSISPIGNSMCPFLLGGRDQVLIAKPCFPLKRGDICVFRRSNQQYVIHRVHHVDHRDGITSYYMLGDNQTELEGPIHECNIYATAIALIRKGKQIDCRANLFYRFTSAIWLGIRPARPFFIRLIQLRNKWK